MLMLLVCILSASGVCASSAVHKVLSIISQLISTQINFFLYALAKLLGILRILHK